MLPKPLLVSHLHQYSAFKGLLGGFRKRLLFYLCFCGFPSCNSYCDRLRAGNQVRDCKMWADPDLQYTFWWILFHCVLGGAVTVLDARKLARGTLIAKPSWYLWSASVLDDHDDHSSERHLEKENLYFRT